MTLDLYRAGVGDRTRSWLALHADERRRRAVQACVLRDPDALWSLTEAHLGLYGSSGVLVSPHALSAHRTGVVQFAASARRQALNLWRPGQDDGQTSVPSLLDTYKIPTVRGEVAAAACYRALRWAGASEGAPFSGLRIPEDHEHPRIKNPPDSAAVRRRVFTELGERLPQARGRKRARLLTARTLLLCSPRRVCGFRRRSI